MFTSLLSMFFLGVVPGAAGVAQGIVVVAGEVGVFLVYR